MRTRRRANPVRGRGARSAERVSHVERNRRTREAAIDATVACLSEEGFSRTSLARIAERAGVSIGAIQHQFGDKAALLGAVIESGSEGLVGQIEDLPRDNRELHERVRTIVDAMWQQRVTPMSRAIFEILLEARNDPSLQQRTKPHQDRFWVLLDRVWMRVFEDVPAPRERHRCVQRLIVTMLNGLSVMWLMPAFTNAHLDELDALTTSVVHLLEQ